MTNRMQNLPQLADIDARLHELTKRLKAIPARLAEHRRPLDQEEALLNEVLVPWQTHEEEIRKRESTIQLAMDTIAKFEEHMKTVTNQTDYAAARKQVDEAHKLNDQLHREIQASREKQEQLAPELEERRERHGRVLEVYQAEEAKLLEEQAELEAEAEKARKKFAELVGPDAQSFLRYYHRLTNGGRLPAVVRVVGGTCHGCYMTIPPQTYNQLIANPDQYRSCSHCNRIIFYDAPEAMASEDPSAA